MNSEQARSLKKGSIIQKDGSGGDVSVVIAIEPQGVVVQKVICWGARDGYDPLEWDPHVMKFDNGDFSGYTIAHPISVDGWFSRSDVQLGYNIQRAYRKDWRAILRQRELQLAKYERERGR